jgi:prolipoprotein diacylglyceryl transferase
MYPTLYHAVADLLGIHLQVLKLVNTFGFFVGFAFLGAALTLASELGRKHALGLLGSTKRVLPPPRAPSLFDVALSAFIAFIVGFKFFGVALGEHALQGGADTQRYLFSSNGHWGAGILCGLGWGYLKFREMQSGGPPIGASTEPEIVEVTPRDHTTGMTGAAALGGFLGAKVFDWLERPRKILELFQHPSIGVLFSGLTIYGGLIVGCLSVYWYARRNKLPFQHVCDAVAPGLMLAYGIGRLGCQTAGDGDWGIVSKGTPAGFEWLPHWFWAYDFPNNVLGSGVPMPSGGFPGYGMHLVPPVYPTPLYESLAAILCFAILWSLRKHIQRPLVITAVYLILNGIERFWVEKIRVNATYDLFGRAITQAEIISTCLFVIGVVMLIVQLRKPYVPPAVPAPVVPAPPATE